MPIVIQSRSFDESDWSDEVWRRTHFEALVVAKNKAKLTGRIYRLVNDQGEVLEEVRHPGPIKGLSQVSPSPVPDWFLLEPSRT